MEATIETVDLENLEAKRKDFEEIEEKFYTSTGKLFCDSMQEFFAKYPALSGICWLQYTPFISDDKIETEHGLELAPSTFKAFVEDTYIVFDGKVIVKDEQTKHEKFDYAISQIEPDDTNILMRQVFNEIGDFLNKFSDEFYYKLFRDYRMIFLDNEAMYTTLYLPTLPKEIKVIKAEIDEAVSEMKKKAIKKK